MARQRSGRSHRGCGIEGLRRAAQATAGGRGRGQGGRSRRCWEAQGPCDRQPKEKRAQYLKDRTPGSYRRADRGRNTTSISVESRTRRRRENPKTSTSGGDTAAARTTCKVENGKIFGGSRTREGGDVEFIPPAGSTGRGGQANHLAQTCGGYRLEADRKLGAARAGPRVLRGASSRGAGWARLT